MRVHVHTHTGSRHSGRRPPEKSQSLHGLPSLRFTPRGSGRPCLEADEGSEGSEERRPGRGGRQKEEGERACQAAAAARPCPPPGDAGAELPARDAGAKTPAAPGRCLLSSTGGFQVSAPQPLIWGRRRRTQ